MTCVLPFFFRLRENVEKNKKTKNEIDEYLWATTSMIVYTSTTFAPFMLTVVLLLDIC